MFSLTLLSIVTPALALSTYLVVFNLDSLVHFYQSTLSHATSRIISWMRNDSNRT